MKRWTLMASMALAAVSLSGCECMRAFDQWKCDTLGICCFGVRPSAQAPIYPAYPQAYPTYPAQQCAPMVADPCAGAACPPTLGPAIVDPCAPGAAYPTPIQ